MRGNDGINKLIKVHTLGTRNDLHQISQGFTIVEIKPFYSAFNEAVLNHRQKKKITPLDTEVK